MKKILRMFVPTLALVAMLSVSTPTQAWHWESAVIEDAHSEIEDILEDLEDMLEELENRNSKTPTCCETIDAYQDARNSCQKSRSLSEALICYFSNRSARQDVEKTCGYSVYSQPYALQSLICDYKESTQYIIEELLKTSSYLTNSQSRTKQVILRNIGN